ncbi:MAG: ribosomal protein S18-alanine N-acetyltransferase [Bacilli bacterium]|nr:ribosomal protein S18-alanine N-acetyltransferase [Bacilli bacterium]
MIRFMKKEDLANIIKIEDASFKDGHYSKDQLLYEHKENPFAKILVNEENKVINGFLIYMVTFNSATIIQIAVNPKDRHNGIATKLLKAMDKELLKQGYGKVENVTLEVRSTNKNAIKLYSKSGYKKNHIKKKYYDNGDDAIYMMKVLL